MTNNNQFNFHKATEKWRLLLASDVVVFAMWQGKLSVLLIKRKFEPGIGKWAIPGGFVREDESLEESALRELKEETGLSKDTYIEQLYTFGEMDRDPRGRVISVAYIALIAEPEKIKLAATDDAAEAKWFEVNDLPPLSFGRSHKEIIMYAWQRLKWKFEYTNVALSMLPGNFTLTQLQKLYEAVYNEPIDKRNFRKKVLSLDMVEPVDEVRREFGRPAQLYKAISKKIKIFPKII